MAIQVCSGERGSRCFHFGNAMIAVSSGPHDGCVSRYRERLIMLGIILLVILCMMVLGALPAWPHSRNWGYYPSSGLGLVVAVVLIVLLLR